MLLAALIVPVLISVAVAEEPSIIVKAYPWAPFISPMGEPFRPPSSGEAPIARWFVGADVNRDGALTADEMQGDADRFFARLDGNRDGEIDPQEITAYEYEIAPDVQVNSQWKRPRGEVAAKSEPDRGRTSWDGSRKREDWYDGYRINGVQGAARYGLLNIPQPVASADADFNRLITLTEFRRAATYRFKLLDSSGQGRISLAELETRLPTRPKGKQAKPQKDALDPRIGLPLPGGE